MQEILITGHVVHGKKVARTLGYPTANFDYTVDTAGVQLEPGVYAGRVRGIREEEPAYEYTAAIVIGGDFKIEQPLKLEAYILGFEGDLYGRTLKVCLHKKLRDMIHFESTEALIAQIKEDVAQIGIGS